MMRFTVCSITLLLTLHLTEACYGQQRGAAAAEGSRFEELEELRVFQFLEFRCGPAAAGDLKSASMIAESLEKLVDQGTIELRQLVRVATAEETSGMASFGQALSFPLAERPEPVKAGTLAQVRFHLRGAEALAQLEYTASRYLDGAPKEQSTGSLLSEFTVQCVTILEPGKPKLLGGSFGDGESFVVVIMEP